MLNGKILLFIYHASRKIFCERVYFDRKLWLKAMLPKLTSFYFILHISFIRAYDSYFVRGSDDIARGKIFFRIQKKFYSQLGWPFQHVLLRLRFLLFYLHH